MKMKRLRFLTMIAVFTALFIGCEEPQDGTDTPNGAGNSGTVVGGGGTEIDSTKFKCLNTLYGNSGYVISVAFSPDGTRIISGSYDNTIKIWNANTGECIKTLEGHSNTVQSVAYSPDGTKIISGSYDKTIKIWDANTGQCLKTLEGHSERVNSVAFNLDGTKIISGSVDNTIKIWGEE
jgi:WD40 repeat protein